MPLYADSFVLPCPKDNVAAYRKLARQSGKVWLDHGALEYRECVADDVQPGKVTSFPQAVQLKDDETVIFSWAIYKSRKHRDEVMAKVMADRRMQFEPGSMPFDGKRMFWGGFTMMVDMKAEPKTAKAKPASAKKAKAAPKRVAPKRAAKKPARRG